MRFLIIRKADAETEGADLPTEELFAQMGDYMAEMAKAGVLLSGDGLQPSRKGARVKFHGGKPTVVDGPFAETKECLGGFTIFEARDFNEAMQLAAHLPAARSGTVEVRALMDPAASLSDPVDRKVAALIIRNARPMSDAQAARIVSAARLA